MWPFAPLWGPICSVGARTRCRSRRNAERNGDAYWHGWYGLIYPMPDEGMSTEPVYTWDTCPWCGGPVRLGIRRLLGTFNADEGEE